MERNVNEKAHVLIEAVKQNLLKPLYLGLKECNEDAKNELLEKLDSLDAQIAEIKEQQDFFLTAIKNLKWDD